MATVTTYRRLALWGTPAGIGVVLLLSLWNHRATEAAFIGRFADRQLALTRTAAVGVGAELAGHAASLAHLGALPSVQRVDVDFLPGRLRHFFSPPHLPGIVEVVRVEADGRTWRWRPDGTPLTPQPEVWGTPEVAAWATQAGSRGTWHPWVQRDGDDVRLLVTLPVYETGAADAVRQPSGRFAGFLGLVLDPAVMAAPYAASLVEAIPSATVEWTDASGEVLFAHGTRLPDEGSHDALLTGHGGEVVTVASPTGAMLESRASIGTPTRPLRVRIAVPREWVVSDVRRLFWREMLLFLALVLTTLGMGWALLRVARSEGRYRELVDRAADGVVVLDRQGRVADVNAAGAAMLGRPPAELVGQAFAGFLATASRDAWGTATAALASGRRTSLALSLQPGQGAPVEADASVSQEAAGHRLVILRDVGERRRLEQQLRQAQKMEAVGRLAGGIAHDFNNLLTAIAGYNDLLLDSFAEGDARRQDALQVRRATERAATLTRQLLAVGRRQVMQPRVLDLNDLVRRLEGLMGRLAGEHITLDLALAADLWPVEADPGQLEQVLINLVVNARDAMPMGGTVVIETANVTQPLEPATVVTGPVPVPGVRLTVADTGAGMSADTLSRIFDPFFTTKPVGQGTGLGLPTAQGIVQQSRGELRVNSAPGAGTRIDVVLPPSARPPAVDHQPESRPVRAPGLVKVLLVEDDPVVRRFTRRTLESLGYAVREAACGEDALSWLQQVAAPPDVLLTDVVMPGMNGVELAAAARRRWPALRVLFASGHSADLLTSQGLSEEGGRLLAKPFTAEQLSVALREVAEQPGAAS